MNRGVLAAVAVVAVAGYLAGPFLSASSQRHVLEQAMPADAQAEPSFEPSDEPEMPPGLPSVVFQYCSQ